MPRISAFFGQVILHVVEAVVCGPHSLLVTFNDGEHQCVNLLPLLDGPVFEALRDPAYFARVVVDPVLGTVVWPNGADLAPEALYELPPEVEPIIMAVHGSDQSEENPQYDFPQVAIGS